MRENAPRGVRRTGRAAEIHVGSGRQIQMIGRGGHSPPPPSGRRKTSEKQARDIVDDIMNLLPWQGQTHVVEQKQRERTTRGREG